MSLEQRLADSARALDAAIDSHVARTAASGRRRMRPHRLIGVAAATIIAIGGGVGVYQLRAGGHPRVSDTAALGSSVESTGPTITGEPKPMDRTAGPLLTTAVPSDVRPLVSVGQAGWSVEKFSGFEQSSSGAVDGCSDCGAVRLVVAADGPLFSGAIFTAWTVDVDYASRSDEYRAPVTIGTTAGRMAQNGPSVPASENTVQLVWPLDAGRTAFVQAYGLSNADVVAMAGLLTFETSVPTMAAPPAGFTTRPTSELGGPLERVGLKFVNGGRVLRLYAANNGFQGLVDGRGPAAPLASGWSPTVVDGATVAFFTPTPGAPPTLGAFATWIAGEWSFAVKGSGFASDADVLATVASLQLTDAENFAALCSGAVITPASVDWFNS